MLLARLRALARRADRPAVQTLSVGDLTLDPTTREVKRGAAVISLTHTEFRVLEFLMRRAGRACSRAAIIDGVWGMEKDVQANAVDAFVRLLRARQPAANRNGFEVRHAAITACGLLACNRQGQAAAARMKSCSGAA